MAVCVICHIIFHSAMIVGAIRFDVMAFPIGNAGKKFSNEDGPILMIHFAKSVRSSPLHSRRCTSSTLP